jgi:flagellar biosynthesis/type III secretory pathway protein FliH
MAEQAREQGFREGHIAGASQALTEERMSREARCETAFDTLKAQLSDLTAQDQRIRSEVELEVAQLVLGVGERILPDLFDSCIADILIARIQSTIQMTTGTGNVTIRIAPELHDMLSPRVTALVSSVNSRSVQFETLPDPQIEDGTVRIEWRNGFLEYDPTYASMEVLECLKEAILELKSQIESIA